MSASDPNISGISASTPPVLQAGSQFSARTYGLDDGRRTFLVHPNASMKLWPQQGYPDKENKKMFVVDVTDRLDASTLVELDVTYRGIAGNKPEKITPDVDVQMLSLPVAYHQSTANVLLPLPQPKVTREYVSLTAPTLAGVGMPTTADWLPEKPTIDLVLTFVGGSAPTFNYFQNAWVLQSRTWEEIVPKTVWFVRERATYYFPIASS